LDNAGNQSFHRLSLLVGKQTLHALSKTNVMVFGLGGVGSWCAEALVRSGVGHITLVDFDLVEISNINRQIQATSKTLGQEKSKTLKERLKDINPECNITAINKYFSQKTSKDFDIPGADYIIDAIDSMESKLELIENAVHCGRTLFSSMGMARKLNPALIRTDSIWKSKGCALARHVREGLRKRGFEGDFTVVYSEEKQPVYNGVNKELIDEAQGSGLQTSKKIIGSAVTVTASAGMILASLVINDIHNKFMLNSNPETDP